MSSENYVTPYNKRRAMSFPTSPEGKRWVEMMLLMDEPPLTQTFEIYEKVVAKSPNGFVVGANGVSEITPRVGEGTSLDGWSEEKRACKRNTGCRFKHKGRMSM
ncbi:hypothetical protein H5410_020278 [Solanum commersonii]|uniref:Uncharacterized protein n=1 Tax=Solanum commersonii TaxID=4109 RepID=A0A9J5Z9M3_SOLCO|nr:hypothetical protein H5410_020278 [Solanum commersonii]